jgi:hypothetical protein
VTTGSDGTERSSIPREFGEFLIELSLALNRIGMYPHGHPSLDRAGDTLLARLATLLAERPTLSLGVAKRQLVVEGVAAETANPVLRSLAARMHRHHIGAVVFQRGVTTDEVFDVLRLLATEERGAQPVGLRDPAVLRSWRNVRLFPLAYDQLELVGEEGSEEEREAARAAQLWMGLARAALAKGEDEHEAAPTTEPSAVAEAINQHPAAQAYDQVIVGYLLQIAGELQTEEGTGNVPLQRRVSHLVSELSEDVLQRLVAMGGDVEQRLRFLLDASAGFGGSAVVELVRAAAGASQQNVSHSMLRILTKLGSLAEDGEGLVQEEAESALRDQVQALVDDWRLADPNPEAYTTALQAMAGSSSATRPGASDLRPEPLRIVEMALELDLQTVHVEEAVDDVLANGGAGALLDVLEAAPSNDGLAGWIWRLLVDPARLGEWIRSGRADLEALDRLMGRAAAGTLAGPLLDALAQEERRERRLALIERAIALGPDIAREATERLRDPRWYVRRNMLHLLRQVGIAPDGGALEHVRDEHALVRREALQLALELTAERERALAFALRDPDPEVLSLAAAAAGTGLPTAVIPMVASRVGDETLTTSLRVQLIDLLGDSRSPLGAEALVRVAARGRTLFGRPRLAPRSPESLAALRALTRLPSPPPHVMAVLRRARSARDPEVRTAAGAA